jgi:hypothetical protein
VSCELWQESLVVGPQRHAGVVIPYYGRVKELLCSTAEHLHLPRQGILPLNRSPFGLKEQLAITHKNVFAAAT